MRNQDDGERFAGGADVEAGPLKGETPGRTDRKDGASTLTAIARDMSIAAVVVDVCALAYAEATTFGADAMPVGAAVVVACVAASITLAAGLTAIGAGLASMRGGIDVEDVLEILGVHDATGDE